MKKVFVIDNYDSFTYNLVHYLEELGCEVIPLHCEVDGTFPNHHPDPTIKSNIIEISDFIKKNSFDLGVAFDGDGDRLIAVNENGVEITGDQLIAICSDYAHSKDDLHNNIVVTTVMSNIGLKAVLENDFYT